VCLGFAFLMVIITETSDPTVKMDGPKRKSPPASSMSLMEIIYTDTSMVNAERLLAVTLDPAGTKILFDNGQSRSVSEGMGKSLIQAVRASRSSDMNAAARLSKTGSR
jgi:hypothetical protein